MVEGRHVDIDFGLYNWVQYLASVYRPLKSFDEQPRIPEKCRNLLAIPGFNTMEKAGKIVRMR